MILLLVAMPALAGDAPGDAMPDRSWDLTHLQLAVRVDPAEHTVAGTAIFELDPLARPAEQLTLHQVGLEVSAVRVDGEPAADWHLGDGDLRIQLVSGRSHEVAVDYRARPETGMHFRSATDGPDGIVEVWTQGEDEDNRHWFPSWDHPSDRFTVGLDLEVPTGLLTASNGALLGQEVTSPGWTRWSWRTEQPIVNYLIAFAAGEYREAVVSGYDNVRVVHPRTLPDVQATTLVTDSPAMLVFFEQLTGAPYPFPAYRQVLTQRFLYSGMENAGASFLAGGLAESPEDVPSDWPERVVSHEAAHQWFGDLVTCYGWRELWLNEGFAHYASALWETDALGPEVLADRLLAWRDGALGAPRPMSARGWSKIDDAPNDRVYSRGATVLHALRMLLGEEAFFAGVRRYVAEGAGQLVESDDLRRALEATSGRHLGWAFDQWVHQGGAPTVTASWTWEAGQLTVHATREGPEWTIPVELEIGEEVPRIVLWTLREPTQELTLPLPQRPAWVAFDPRGGAMARLEVSQDTSDWIRQATRSPSPLARRTAMVALGEHPEQPAATDTLIAIAMNVERPFLQRRGAIEALEAQDTKSAAAALVTLLDDDDPRVRADACSALASFEADPDLGGPLARLVARDPFDGVRAEALGALMAHQPDAARSAARAALRGPDGTREHLLYAVAYDVLGETGEAADLGRALSAVDDRWSAVQASAVEAVLAMRGRLPATVTDRHEVAVHLRLAGLLGSSDQITRWRAIGWLRRLGTEEAAVALEAFAARTRLEDHREAAKGAIAAIRSPKDPLHDLEERVKALEEKGR